MFIQIYLQIRLKNYIIMRDHIHMCSLWNSFYGFVKRQFNCMTTTQQIINGRQCLLYRGSKMTAILSQITVIIIIILSATVLKGTSLNRQLLASRPCMSSDTEVDDHAASIEVMCGQHVVFPSRYSRSSQAGFTTYHSFPISS